MNELTLCCTLEVSNSVLAFLGKKWKDEKVTESNLPASGFHCKTKAKEQKKKKKKKAS